LPEVYKNRFSIPISLTDDAGTNTLTAAELPSPLTGETQVVGKPQGKRVTSIGISVSGSTAVGSGLFCQEVGKGAALLSAKDVMLEAMKAQFYKVFGPMHQEVKNNGSKIINKEKYDQIVDALRRYNTFKKKDQFMKNCWNRYALKTNVKDNLFRKVTKKEEYSLKKVIWYGRIFVVIHDMHVSLAHSSYARTHKIMIDKTWYGLPETAIKVYI
jgi:hypothetical protein